MKTPAAKPAASKRTAATYITLGTDGFLLLRLESDIRTRATAEFERLAPQLGNTALAQFLGCLVAVGTCVMADGLNKRLASVDKLLYFTRQPVAQQVDAAMARLYKGLPKPSKSRFMESAISAALSRLPV